MGKPESIVLLSSKVMISEEAKLHPVFLTVQFLMASNQGNLNREGVTKAFIDDFVSRKDVFECLPMYVDMEKLLDGDFDNLTHLYNRATKKFGTTQFGSLTNFYEETDEDGVTSLYAEARFPKRELAACMRLVELYEQGRLCVSVELRYNPEHTVKKNGVTFIDAYEDNALTGLCIVSEPAEVRAVALDMVAEKQADDSQIVTDGGEPTNRGENEMNKNKKDMTAEVTEEIVETEAEDATVAVSEAEVSDADKTVMTAADGDPEDDTNDDADESEGPVVDPDDEEEPKKPETEDTQAQVLEHSVDVHESVEHYCEDCPPVHVTEVVERVVETLEPDVVIAQQKETIAKLEAQVAQLNEIAEKYNAIIAEREAAELAEKKANAKAFAERQGLDTQDVAVAEAIESLDYTKIAELTMAQVQEKEVPAEPEAAEKISLASYVEFEINNDGYGGLLQRRTK